MTSKEFIAQHKHKNYCEIVISPTGDIEYAIPSHLYKMMAITGKDKNELDEMIPEKAAPLPWLVEYTGYGAVWYDYVMLPKQYTCEQISTLVDLMSCGVMVNYIQDCHISQEKTICELHQKFYETLDRSYLEQIKPMTLELRGRPVQKD